MRLQTNYYQSDEFLSCYAAISSRSVTMFSYLRLPMHCGHMDLIYCEPQLLRHERFQSRRKSCGTIIFYLVRAMEYGENPW